MIYPWLWLVLTGVCCWVAGFVFGWALARRNWNWEE